MAVTGLFLLGAELTVGERDWWQLLTFLGFALGWCGLCIWPLANLTVDPVRKRYLCWWGRLCRCGGRRGDWTTSSDLRLLVTGSRSCVPVSVYGGGPAYRSGLMPLLERPMRTRRHGGWPMTLRPSY